MKYSIKLLQEEKAQIKKSLENWDIEFYPEHHKEVIEAIKELTKAIRILKKA